MAYFKYSISFLNTLTYASSSYTELDDFLKGTVKGFLSHNQGFLLEVPTMDELAELKSELESVYSQMLLFVKPKYQEVKRLTSQTLFQNEDTVVSEHGDETQTGSYYEPKVNNTQAQINTNGQKSEWEDDTTTTTKKEYRTLDDQAVKQFFVDIKPEVEDFFIDFVNLYACDEDGVIGGSLTQAQMDAINSGINSTKVAQIQTNADAISNIEDSIDIIDGEIEDLQQAVDSAEARLDVDEANIETISNKIPLNASSTNKLVAQSDLSSYATITALGNETTARENADTSLQNDIADIVEVIPSQASSSNQLADKNFVNSSIATNTANFKGTFNTLAELQSVANPTANDYGFVISTDAQGNTVYNRYKYNGTTWAFEYALNNSSFTASQWATIQSGLSSSDKTKLDGIQAGAQVNTVNSVNGQTGAVVLSIPTKTSDLTNDSNFVASGSNVSQFVNDANYLTNADVSNKANNTLNNLGTINPTLTSTTETHAGKSGIKKVGGHFVIESWVASDNSMWYRKYSDGWKECGGKAISSNDNTVHITLPLTFSNTEYTTIGSYADNTGFPLSYTMVESSSRIVLRWPTSGNKYVMYYCCGY